MSNTTLVGCRLPSGITLDAEGIKVELNGLNTAMIQGGVGLTHVDTTEWSFLKEYFKDHSAFTSNAVFAYKESASVADVVAIADELQDEKTGFEGLDPNAPAKGLEPEDKAKLKAELNKNAVVKPGAKAPKSAKDKAAAAEQAIVKG